MSSSTASTVLAAVLLAILATAPIMAADQPLNFTRQRFDEMDKVMDGQRDIANAPADDFAWGEGYMMRGYVEMYQGTGDRDYLRRLVRVADAILQTRDDRRPGAPRGARPTWTIAGRYTQSSLMLKDNHGRDAIWLRSIRYGINDGIEITVIPGSQPGTFTLTTACEFWQQYGPADAAFENLSLDRESPRYFERVINDHMYVPTAGDHLAAEGETKPSFLILALDARSDRTEATELAPVSQALLAPASVPYYGYTGPIYSAMTRFAKVIHDDPALQPEFAAAADRYLTAAKESLVGWDRCWRQGPREGEGYYVLVPKGGGFWCDGLAAPTNYLGGAGQVLLNLWDCRRDPRALDRATRLARMFKRCCTVTPQGGYTFGYWMPEVQDGWTRAENLSINTPEYPANMVADDLSHGSWQVSFAVMCYERGIVFDRQDMERFARTFTRQLWDPKGGTLAMRVDGSGGPADGGNGIAGTGWLELATIDPQIFDINRQLWTTNRWDKGVYGHLAGGYARMLRWQEQMGR